MVRRLVVAWVALAACGEPVQPPRTPLQPVSDKRALYADPALVPTRQGEHARRELALAGEVESSLRIDPAIEQVRCNVELEPAQTRVLVSVRAVFGADADRLRRQAETVAHAVAGTSAVVTTSVAVREAPATPEEGRRLDVPLAIALLGFGISAGVMTERLRRVRRSRRRRR